MRDQVKNGMVSGRSASLIALVCLVLGLQTSTVEAARYTEEQLLYHMEEYKAGLHPLQEIRRQVDEKGPDLVALERITLSEADQKACDEVRAELAAKQAAWDQENEAELKEAMEMIIKYRKLTGPENLKLYKQWHSKKVQMARSRPRSEASDFLPILSEEGKAAFEDEASRMRFWYLGHGHAQKILDLMLLGLSADEAIRVEGEYVKASSEAKKGVQLGEEGSEKLHWEAFFEAYKKEHGLVMRVPLKPIQRKFENQPYRDWSYEINGKAGKINAKLVEINIDQVELASFGGKRGVIALEAFSEADQAYLNEVGRSQDSDPTEE